MVSFLAPLAAPILKGIFGVLDQKIEDKDLLAKIKSELSLRQMDIFGKELQGAVSIILAESRGNFLQKSWRPILMLSVVAIIVNNYILVPYAVAFGAPLPMLELPDQLWTLLTVGVGGYVVGRSSEKVAETLGKNGLFGKK